MLENIFKGKLALIWVGRLFILNAMRGQMQQLLNLTTHWCRPYLTEISFSFIATLLVLYGDRINGEIKKITDDYHYLIRVVIFILVSGFGYGWMTVYMTDLLEKILRYKTGNYLGLVVLVVFFVLGMLADKKKYI